MGGELIALMLIVGIGVFLLTTVLVLPRRKASYEKALKPIYEERCSINWVTKSGLLAGGNLPAARVSYYSDFFVVAFMGITKIKYTEIKSTSYKKSLLSSWVKVDISGGSSLRLYSKNTEIILKLLKGRKA